VSVSDQSISPHYFGGPDARLFGCYHAAPAGVTPRGHMLVCNPMGHEFLGSHRAVRQLAVRLAQAGCPALRFDFFGTGDSAGDSSAGTLCRWLHDITEAVLQLKTRAGRGPVSLLGLRLGGSLALWHLQGVDAVECESLVLWDPIVNGREYVAELLMWHRERLGAGEANEILGMPFGHGLRSEIEGMDLLTVGRPKARRILIVTTGADSSRARSLAERLTQLGSDVSSLSFEAGLMWNEPGKAAVPNTVIQSIVSWTKGQ